MENVRMYKVVRYWKCGGCMESRETNWMPWKDAVRFFNKCSARFCYIIREDGSIAYER